MSNNVEVTTATKPLYLQHCSKRSRDCCIQSEASLQLKLPSVNSPSICEASDSLTTIYHLYSVEAARTVGSSLAENGTREAERGKEREKKRIRRELDRLTWQSYLELSLAGLPGLDWIWFGFS